MSGVGVRLVEAGLRADDSQYLAVCLSAEFADSFEWAAEGYSSAGLWIADQLDIARRTANDWIRIGRALRELPLTACAFEQKRISFAKVKVLTRSATIENEADLVQIAECVSAAELPKEIARWLQRVETEEQIDERQEQARSLTWQTEADGTVFAALRLAPSDASVLMSAVDAAVMRQSQKLRGADHEWPSLAQQRADALVAVLTASGAGMNTEVLLHVRGDGATLDDGTPITESSIGRSLGEAFIRLLIHDAERQPINASSRQRHPTARQKRVVKERDRSCVDCGSYDLPQYDHMPDFEESRRTVVEELQLRCGPCHRARHAAA